MRSRKHVRIRHARCTTTSSCTSHTHTHTHRGTWKHTLALACTDTQAVDVSALVCVQLVANAVLFTSVNLSGVFVKVLTERAQRKVFLQARNCIEERLKLEEENEKQVRRQTNTR